MIYTTLWFWFVLVEFVFLCVMTACHNVGLGLFTLALACGLLQFTAKIDLWGWVVANPNIVVWCVLGYFPAGGVWSLLKWYWLVLDERDRYLEIKRKFMIENGLEPDAEIPPELKDDFKHATYEFPPRASEHVEEILTWILFFPFSILVTVLGDFTVRLARRVYRALSGIYAAIARHVFPEIPR